MAERMICNTSKHEHSLSQISELIGPTIDEFKEAIGQTTGLTLMEFEVIFDMMQRGLSLEEINQETGVALEVLKQLLPQVIQEQVKAHTLPDRSPPTTSEEPISPLQPTKPQHSHMPSFFYYCEDLTNKLHRVNLLTGEQSCLIVSNYVFKFECRWSELPGVSLFITGGGDDQVGEVVKIDTPREWAVCSLPPMTTSRRNHAAVYHYQYLYVLGG
jgi:hypothetical protein